VATSGCSVELQDAMILVIDMAPREGEMGGGGVEPEEGAGMMGSSKGGSDPWRGDSNRQRRRWLLGCREVGDDRECEPCWAGRLLGLGPAWAISKEELGGLLR
jgi:hypothetical protein